MHNNTSPGARCTATCPVVGLLPRRQMQSNICPGAECTATCPVVAPRPPGAGCRASYPPAADAQQPVLWPDPSPGAGCTATIPPVPDAQQHVLWPGPSPVPDAQQDFHRRRMHSDISRDLPWHHLTIYRFHRASQREDGLRPTRNLSAMLTRMHGLQNNISMFRMAVCSRSPTRCATELRHQITARSAFSSGRGNAFEKRVVLMRTERTLPM